MWGDELMGGVPNSPGALLERVGVNRLMVDCSCIFKAMKSR